MGNAASTKRMSQQTASANSKPTKELDEELMNSMHIGTPTLSARNTTTNYTLEDFQGSSNNNEAPTRPTMNESDDEVSDLHSVEGIFSPMQAQAAFNESQLKRSKSFELPYQDIQAIHSPFEAQAAFSEPLVKPQKELMPIDRTAIEQSHSPVMAQAAFNETLIKPIKKLMPIDRTAIEQIHSPVMAQAAFNETLIKPKKEKRKTSAPGRKKVEKIPTPRMAQSYINAPMVKPPDKTNSLKMTSIANIHTGATHLIRSKRDEEKLKRKNILNQYPELKDVLSEIEVLLEGMEKDIETDQTRKTMSLKTQNSLKQIYDFYFDVETKEQRKIIGDDLARNNATYLLTEYCKILGKKADENQYIVSCIYLLRSVLWNYTDSSMLFSEELAKMGIIQVMTDDLIMCKDNYDQDKNKEFIVTSGISILHNCAKSPNNVKYYKDKKTMDIIVHFSTVESSEIKMIAMITLAYIVDEESNNIIATDGRIIEDIILLLKKAIETPTHTADGFSINELLVGLRKLASNGNNSVTIVDKGILPVLEQLLAEGNEEEREDSARFVWVLSFNDANKDKILASASIIGQLETLIAKEPRSEAGKAAAGALWVLKKLKPQSQERKTISSSISLKPSSSLSIAKKKKKKSKQARESNLAAAPPPPPTRSAVSKLASRSRGKVTFDESTLDPEETDTLFSENSDELVDMMEEVSEMEEIEQLPVVTDGHIMISYQWDHQKLLLRIKVKLEQLGYKVWMDVDQMSGSTLQAMADAVERADVVLMCMSQKYKNSANCRTEAEYAYELHKEIFPLKVEADYSPDGWLGAIRGSKFYFDFSSLNQFDKMIEKLSKQLGDKGKNNTMLVPVDAKPLRSAPPIIAPKVKHPGQWGPTDVQKWMEEHNIKSKKISHMEGSALLFLSTLRIQAPEFYFRYLHETLALTDLKDIMIVSTALDKLRSQTLS